MAFKNHSPNWRVLLVEDDEDDFILTRNWLSGSRGSRIEVIWASTYDAVFAALASSSLDAILVDYDLGAYSGLDVVRELERNDCRLPIIMLTGRGNYEIDVEAMQAGVSDYLAKSEVTPQLLERTIRYAIERKQREQVLRQMNDELELRVNQRTAELIRKNEALQDEIEERRRIEAEFEELQRRLFNSVEAERLKLSQELHDGPMQDLYGLTYQLKSLHSVLDENQSDELLGELQVNLLAVIHALRAITGELRPPTLAPFGLEKAIRSHSEQFRKSQPELEIRLNLAQDGQLLPEEVRLALFRIYQMALTNVARHAQASRVDILLSLDAEAVMLEVRDDGRGFELPSRWLDLARKGHYGLASASERAEAVGGRLVVETQPGAGTRLKVWVPREIED
jgi:signal transduction histidine kinase